MDALPAGIGFLPALAAELRHHVRALVLVALCLLLLALARKTLSYKPRIGFVVLCHGLFLLSLPLRALLLHLGVEGPGDETIELPAMLLYALGLIGFAGMLVFDIVGRSRVRKLRILRTVGEAAAGVVVLFVLLHRSGVNLASLVATSAVLTGVVGFALQETLGNVIGGIALQLESTISIGDWIQVGEVNGQVSEIRWRSMSLLTRDDDLVVIPNGLVAKATFTNFSRPVPWHRRWVFVDIHLRHPPNEVQQTILEALVGVANVKPRDPAPDCILHRIEQDHMRYAVRYRLTDLRQDDGTDSEVRERIWYALRRQGIDIAWPTRSIYVTEQSAERKQSKKQREVDRRLAALRRLPLFQPLDEAALLHLARGARFEVFAKDETILRQGAGGDSLYILRRGAVSVRVAGGEQEREVATLGDGDIFGEMSLLTGEPRRATVIAIADSECYVIDRPLMQKVMVEQPKLAEEISHLLTTREQELASEANKLDVPASEGKPREALLVRIRAFFGLGGS